MKKIELKMEDYETITDAYVNSIDFEYFKTQVKRSFPLLEDYEIKQLYNEINMRLKK